MKNKIFLTSMLAILMASPAFATDHQATTYTDDNNYVNGEIPSGSTTEACGGYAITWHNSPVSNGTITYEAQWTADQFDVIYNPGTCGGTSYTDTDGATYDENYTALEITSTNTSVPIGYTWLGWSTDSNSAFTRTGAMTGTITNAFTGATPWQRTADLTVYGTCIANQYTVTYNVGSCGGSNYTHTNGATYGSNYSVPAAATSAITAPTGSTWVGWNTASGQSTANWTGATPWQSTSDLTVYAVCSTNQYILAYDCNNDNNGETPSVSGNQYSYGADVQLLANEDTCVPPTGYHFDGWTCLTDTEGIAADFDNGMPADDVTCTAQWTPNAIGLQWIDDDGTDLELEPEYCTLGDSDGITPIEQPSKTGYTFNGWKVIGWTNQ